jgi:hypothetical protein
MISHLMRKKSSLKVSTDSLVMESTNRNFYVSAILLSIGDDTVFVKS